MKENAGKMKKERNDTAKNKGRKRERKEAYEQRSAGGTRGERERKRDRKKIKNRAQKGKTTETRKRGNT